jgi:hypothetical protein
MSFLQNSIPVSAYGRLAIAGLSEREAAGAML